MTNINDEALVKEEEELINDEYIPAFEKQRAPVFFEPYDNELTIYIGDDSEKEIYVEDFINYYELDLELEKVELLGLKDACIGCGSSSSKLTFRAEDLKAGTYPFAVFVFDETTKST